MEIGLSFFASLKHSLSELAEHVSFVPEGQKLWLFLYVPSGREMRLVCRCGFRMNSTYLVPDSDTTNFSVLWEQDSGLASCESWG